MNIYKSNFEDNCKIVFDSVTGIEASVICTAITEFAAPGTSVIWSYSLDDKDTWIAFRPDIDLVLNDIITDIDLQVDVTSLGGSYQMVNHVAGIVFMLHETSAWAIFNDQMFTDALEYPNTITCYLDLDVDSTNGGNGRSVTPKASLDDGVTWVELTPDESYTIVAQDDPYWRYKFEYTSLTPFEQMRPAIYLETTLPARTPRVRNVSFICSLVE